MNALIPLATVLGMLAIIAIVRLMVSKRPRMPAWLKHVAMTLFFMASSFLVYYPAVGFEGACMSTVYFGGLVGALASILIHTLTYEP